MWFEWLRRPSVLLELIGEHFDAFLTPRSGKSRSFCKWWSWDRRQARSCLPPKPHLTLTPQQFTSRFLSHHLLTMPALLSIQSYFSSSPAKNSDGFTANEVQSALAPAGAAWAVSHLTPLETTSSLIHHASKPTLDYEEVALGTLEPGPRNLALIGRVVYFNDQAKPSKSHKAAQGCIKIMLADDTGVLTVRLWYANTQYKLKLGQLVSVWTVHISNSSEHNSLAPNTAPLFTTIFPEGERNCYFMVHESSDDGTRFKRPYGVRESKVLPGLMTLKSFTDGGYDIDEPKLLVCVKSIGARKKCTCSFPTSSSYSSLTSHRYEPQRHNLRTPLPWHLRRHIRRPPNSLLLSLRLSVPLHALENRSAHFQPRVAYRQNGETHTERQLTHGCRPGYG
jgi:hypothetical protein